MAFHDNVFKLEQIGPHQGLSPTDILVEIKQVTLAAGTAECPTVFANGNIIAVQLTHVNNATVNATVALSTDMVVTTGAITVVGPTGSTAVVSVVIYGRLSI